MSQRRIRVESRLNQRWKNKKHFAASEQLSLNYMYSHFQHLHLSEKSFICFLFKTFFHTVLRHTCWKWVDTSTLIQLITFNCFNINWQSLKVDRNITAFEKGLTVQHKFFSTFTTEFHQSLKIGWMFPQPVEDHLSLQLRFNSHCSTIFQPM